MSSANPTRIDEFNFNVTCSLLAGLAADKTYHFVFSKHSKNVCQPQLGQPSYYFSVVGDGGERLSGRL